MKCARCAHQWKITPETVVDDEGAVAEMQSQQPAQDQRDTAPADDRYAQAVHEDAGHGDPHQHGESTEEAHVYDEQHETGVPEESWASLQVAGQRPSMFSPGQFPEDSYDESGMLASAGQESPEEASETTDGLPSWLKRKTDTVAEGAEPVANNADDPYDDQAVAEQPETPTAFASEQRESWSSRFMGPGWKNPSAAEAVVGDEDEDPETIIRESFKSALEHSDEEEYAQPETGGEAADSPSSYGSILEADWNRADDGQAQPAGEQAFEDDGAAYADPQFEEHLQQAEASVHMDADQQGGDEYYSEQDAELSDDTPSFLRRGVAEPEQEDVYGSYAEDYGQANNQYDDAEVEPDVFAEPGTQDQAFGAQNRLDDFGMEPDRFDSAGQAQNYDELTDGQFENAAEQRIDENELSDDILGLNIQDDADQQGFYPPEAQSRNGLAVAAAWAVFLFVMGGVVMGLLSFRQELTTALPGTIELYRALGYDVSPNKVDFAAVDYRWGDAEGRPMIEVKGQVVNITDETVKVPPVLVNVQSSSAAPVIATASVPTDALGPRDRATFTLELVSPPEDVTQIELEFAPTQ